MNRIKGLVAISAFALLILGLPAIASAQWNGGYGGNGGYGNRGYGNYGGLRSVVRNLKNRAVRFEEVVDRWDDRRDDRDDRRGGWGGWGNNNGRRDLEQLADRFRNATDDLEDAFGRGRNLENSEDEARRVLDIASQIDRVLNNGRRGGGNLSGQWNSMRQDLNALASAYGYRGGRRSGGGWRNNLPF